MNTKGFRQTNAWLHTWSGLLLGWLLFAIFATGTLSFFRDEISFWMQPEQHGSVANESTPERVMAAMQAMAPDASLWSITQPVRGASRGTRRNHGTSAARARVARG